MNPWTVLLAIVLVAGCTAAPAGHEAPSNGSESVGVPVRTAPEPPGTTLLNETYQLYLNQLQLADVGIILGGNNCIHLRSHEIPSEANLTRPAWTLIEANATFTWNATHAPELIVGYAAPLEEHTNTTTSPAQLYLKHIEIPPNSDLRFHIHPPTIPSGIDVPATLHLRLLHDAKGGLDIGQFPC